jgi:hypothetical protein
VSAGSFSDAFCKLEEEALQHNVHDLPAAMADVEEAEQVVHQLSDIAMHSQLHHLIVIKEKMQESGAALSMFFSRDVNCASSTRCCFESRVAGSNEGEYDRIAARLAFRENPCPNPACGYESGVCCWSKRALTEGHG